MAAKLTEYSISRLLLFPYHEVKNDTTLHKMFLLSSHLCHASGSFPAMAGAQHGRAILAVKHSAWASLIRTWR